MKKTSGIGKNNLSSPKLLDRKTIEKNRRNHMKALFFKLASLIPSQHFNTVATTSKHTITQQDQLDVAATYITQLRERIDQLKRAKEQASMKSSPSSSLVNPNPNHRMGETKRNGSELPVVELRDMGSWFEVVLVDGLQRNFMLYEVIGILEDECAEVVAVSFSTHGDRVFLTIHAQVSAQMHLPLQQLVLTSNHHVQQTINRSSLFDVDRLKFLELVLRLQGFVRDCRI